MAPLVKALYCLCNGLTSLPPIFKLMAHGHNSQFGPPSDLIDVSKFIQGASDIPLSYSAIQDKWSNLAEEKRNAVATECSVSEIQSSLIQTWTNPRLYAHLTKSHDDFLRSIHQSADTSAGVKRKRVKFIDPVQEHSEVRVFQDKLDAIYLKSWPLLPNSALFMRGSKNSDQNVLTDVKKMSMDSTPSSLTDTHQALITVSVHNRLSWNQGYFSRSSQHALLSSQTLGDLFEAIPCTSNELPEEGIDGEPIVGCSRSQSPISRGCVVCIEGVVYGDGQSETDYAEKLMQQVEQMPAETRPPITKSATAMRVTTLASLCLRLNEPYWLLHQGNCEHFLVIDQIRLWHPSDPPSGYPLTLQVTPRVLSMCRGCMKVPAIWSIVGDMRLGESPCLLCGPCWRNMGNPNQEDDVVVVPLPKHDHGW